MSGTTRRRRSWRGLRSQVLVWIVLPAGLLLLASSLISIYSHQQWMKTLVEERDLALATSAAQQVEDHLAQCQEVLVTVHSRASDSQGGGTDLSVLLQELSPQLSLFDGGVALLDANGDVLAARPEDLEWTGRVGELWPQVSQVIGGEASSALATLGESRSAPLRVAMVVAGEGRVAAVVGIFSLESPGITGIVAGVTISGEGVAYLIDSEGNILFHPDAAMEGTNALDFLQIDRSQMGQAAAGVYKDVAGRDVMVAHAPVEGRGWSVIVQEPWGSLLLPTMRYSVLAPIVVALVALMAFLAIYLVVRQVLQPLEELGRRANKIAWGDFSAVDKPVGGIAEIDELRQTLHQMADRIHAYQSAMHDYMAAVTQGQEDERLRLGHELHDDTVQSLVVLSQDLERLDRRLPANAEDLHESVMRLRDSVNSVISSLRRYIGDLRPVYLEDLGLVPALQKLADDLADGQDVKTEFKATGIGDRLPANTELAIFRIVQEALKNVQQHAQASRVAVRVEADSEGVTGFIEDDGVGFVAPETPSELAQLGHFGLMGMQERAMLLGGWLSIGSELGKGTRIIFHVPVGGSRGSAE
jgi:signal transduction histidine kinase